MSPLLWIGVVVGGWLALSVISGTLFALAAAARHRRGPDRVVVEVVPPVLPWQPAPAEHRATSEVRR